MSFPAKRSIPDAPRGWSARTLARKIFEAEVPEEFIKTVAPQSLYLAIKHNGLSSSADLIEIATLEQCRILLDFDCWHKDEIEEENLWEWLGLADENDNLKLLGKLIKCIDLKLLALLISKHVKSEVFEEPTDLPPGPHHYSPDQGYTWIRITLEESSKHFLLGRLLAFLFENKTELFYQLISIPQVATETQLAEESYQDKLKRLLAEGIPDDDFANALNSPLDETSLKIELGKEEKRAFVEDISIVEPLLYDSSILRPLGTLLAGISPREEFESELTLIMNGAIVKWAVEFHDFDQVAKLTSKVKGALNIGLELSLRISSLTDIEIYRVLGLQKLYRSGLSELLSLRKGAFKVEDEKLRGLEEESAVISLVAGLREPFPELPAFFSPDGSFMSRDDGTLEGGYRAIETIQEVASARRLLDELL